MICKGQPTQDNSEAGPSGLIQKEKNKRKEDDARGLSGTSVKQKVKEKKKNGSSEKKKTEGPKKKTRFAPKTGGIKTP